MAAEPESNDQQLSYVPEIILKKRKSNEEWALRRKQQFEDRVRRSKENNKSFIFKRAEQYIRENRLRELDLIQMKCRGKKRKPVLVTPKSGLLFVVRIRGKNDMHPRIMKILRHLRLWKVFTGIFVKVNDRVVDLLQKVEPYVTYGYPNLKSIKDLVYKKGFAKIDGQRVALTNNLVIEEALGKYGMLCIEDVVHEIANIGPHFKEVTGFLWPFKLNKLEGGLKGLKKPYKEGGESGNREDDINELLSKMN